MVFAYLASKCIGALDWGVIKLNVDFTKWHFSCHYFCKFHVDFRKVHVKFKELPMSCH